MANGWWTRTNAWARKVHVDHGHWRTVAWFASPLASALALFLAWLQAQVAPTVGSYLAVAVGWVFIGGLALAVLAWIWVTIGSDDRGFWAPPLGLAVMLIATAVLYAFVGRYFISFTPSVEGLTARQARLRLIDADLLPVHTQPSMWSVPERALIVQDQWPPPWVPTPHGGRVTLTLALDVSHLEGTPVGALVEYGLSYNDYVRHDFHDWYLGDLKPAWLRHAELRAHTPDGFNSVAYRFYEVLKLQLPGFAGVDPSSGLLVTGVPGILSPLLTAAVSEETVVWDSVDGSLTFAPVTLGDSLEQMDQKATAAARPFVFERRRVRSWGEIWGIYREGRTVGLLRKSDEHSDHVPGWAIVSFQRSPPSVIKRPSP